MKIAHITEAAYTDGGPRFKKLTNKQIISKFMIHEPELSEEAENDHYYTRKEIHIYDKGKGDEVNWVVVYPPGTRTVRGGSNPNTEPIYFSVDHDNDREWRTDPQKWQISHLQVLFDG